jgi:hypothetical protein
MEISALAGKPALKNLLVDLTRLEREYYERVHPTFAKSAKSCLKLGQPRYRLKALRAPVGLPYEIARSG